MVPKAHKLTTVVQSSATGSQWNLSKVGTQVCGGILGLLAVCMTRIWNPVSLSLHLSLETKGFISLYSHYMSSFFSVPKQWGQSAMNWGLQNFSFSRSFDPKFPLAMESNQYKHNPRAH